MFHKTIIAAAESHILLNLLEHIAPLPFRSTPMLLNLGKQYAKSEMEASLRDHKTIFEAITSGAGIRAEFVMREHALIPLKQTSLLIQKFGRTTEDI